MAILPVVRYMLLCEDWELDPPGSHRIIIRGLITNIRSLEDPPFPLFHPGLCVFLALTDVHEAGASKIVCVNEQDGSPLFELGPRTIPRAADPLEVVGVPFRKRDIEFPEPGLYTVQFWFTEELVEQRSFRLR